MLLQRGARILLRTLRTEDPLRGTELLLTAAGRATLTELYRAQIEVAGEPLAVCSGADWFVGSLDSQAFFSDYSRENDISYYEVNEPDGTLKITQPSGYQHCVPRELVSLGEKKIFVETLLTLDLECLAAARGDETATKVGLSLRVDGDVERYLKAGAKSQVPDYFAARVDSVDAVRETISALEANRSRMELGSHVNLKGIRYDDAEESKVGFDTPVLFLPAKGVDLAQVVAAARESSVVAGVVAPDALAPEAAEALGATCAVLSPAGDGGAAEVVHAP